MTIRGSSVYSSISEQVRSIENKQERASSKVYDFERKIATLVSQKDDAFTNLALIYLPEMTAKSVSATLREVRADVQRIFDEKQARRKELEQNMDSCNSDRKSLEEKLSTVNSQIEKKVSEREALKKSIFGALSETHEYTDLVKTADVLKATLDKNEARLAQVEKESKEKLPAYKSNPLFSYLLKKDDGSSKFGFFDSFVSRVVNYSAQKRNYDDLVNRPVVVKEEVEKRRAAYKEVSGKITALEQAQAESVGLPKVLNEGNALVKQKDSIASQIAKVDSNYASYANERKEMDSKKDAYHREALDKLKDYLSGDSLSDLRRKALETPSKEDDNLVAKIDDYTNQIEQLKDQAAEAKRERDTLSRKVEDLRDIERDFRSRGYNSSDSYFPSSFDIKSLLAGYVLGNADRSSIDSTIRRNHHVEEPTPVYTPTRHSSSDWGSSSSSWGSSSHSSGSSFGSGGGFGGGGFSSGKGF